MVLGIAEDYTTGGKVILDEELKNPSSGIFINRGVSPVVSLRNLLQFLPFETTTFDDWDNSKDYFVYDSVDTKDIVVDGGVVYQCIKDNKGLKPSEDKEHWIPTNLESLKIKSFMERVKDRVFSDLNLTKNLINNQYIYDVGDKSDYQIPNDFTGFAFDSKGSDYTVIRINEICVESDTVGDEIKIYVINQGLLIDELTVKTDKGRVLFDFVDYEFKGKGEVIFVIDKQIVRKGVGNIDPLRFDGFTVRTVNGIGDDPATAKYSTSNSGNGMGFNISVFLDSESYIKNNSRELANYYRATFEYMAYELFMYNPDSRSNKTTKSIPSDDVLYNEITSKEGDTVASRRVREKDKMINSIRKVFDTQLDNNNSFKFKRSSI